MKIWRCAGKRPFGSPCRRRVGRRARWNTTWRCWTGPLCDRCWRDALRYEPDRDAAIALDPNAPEWVLAHLSRSRDDLVLANLAARGTSLDAAVRRRVLASGSPLVGHALEHGGTPTPAWSLYRSTPRPGVTAASAVAVLLAFGGVSLLESAHRPTAAGPEDPTPVAPSAGTGPSSRVATSSAPVASPPAPVTTTAVTLVVRPDVVPAATLPAAAPALGPTSVPAAAPPSTATVPTTTTAAAPPPPIQAVQVPDEPQPAPVATSSPAPASPVAPATVSRTLSFEVPFPATVAYVASYGIDEVVLRSPDGTTFTGVTSAEGSGPAGTWTATVRTTGPWAGEFTSRG